MSSSKQGDVAVVVQGGLGNQLFQFAAASTIAAELGAAVSVRNLGAYDVDLADFAGPTIAGITPAALARLQLVTPLPLVSRAAQRMRRQLRTKQGQLCYLHQSHLDAFAPRPKEQPGAATTGMLLTGYFQHPTWYDASAVALAGHLRARIDQRCQALDGTGATVISFRRGDYVRMGWDLPLGYYEAALRVLPPMDGPVWVIGDDRMFLELVGGWLGERGLQVRPLPDLGVPPIWRDLALLASAERVVMSNSTFCWWGVVAGQTSANDRTRSIIAPKHWVPIDHSDALIRPGWTTVDSEDGVIEAGDAE